MGIEPTRPAWKAGILAIELHPRRTDIILSQKTAAVKIFFEFFGNFHFFAFRFRVTSLKTESRRNFFEILSFRVGLSMMCYKNQKTSPKDKKEYK